MRPAFSFLTASLRSAGLRAAGLPLLSLPAAPQLERAAASLWAMRDVLFPAPAPPLALAGFDGARFAADDDSGAEDSALDPSAVLTMNRNKRECVARAAVGACGPTFLFLLLLSRLLAHPCARARLAPFFLRPRPSLADLEKPTTARARAAACAGSASTTRAPTRTPTFPYQSC